MDKAVKHFDFTQLPLGNKSIDAIPYLDMTNVIEFKRINFTKAYQVIGEYLLLNKNNDLMDIWLQQNIPSMTEYNRHKFVEVIHVWTQNNI